MERSIYCSLSELRTMYDSDIYYPGEEIIVKGQMPGMGISATAIWKMN